MRPEDCELRVLPGIREVPQQAWDALVGVDSSPFVEWTWLDCLEETGCVGGETGWVPAHLSLWHGGQLVAAAPSYVKGHSEGEFVFDWSWAEASHRLGVPYYPKVVVAVPFTPATGDRVLVAPGLDRSAVIAILAAAARSWCTRAGASGVHVLFAREAEACSWESSGYLRRDGFQYHWFREGALVWDDYLARFSSKQRNQIKREVRGVAERGIAVRTLEPEEHTGEVARAMHAFYASTVTKHGVWGRMYLTPAFFERIVERFHDRLAWVLARDGATGAPIAGAFNVVRGRRLYGRYWGVRDGVDVPYLHFAVCYYEGVRMCLERRLDIFEPGAGGEHKRARGFVPTTTFSAHWLRDARLRSALGPWLAHERRRVASLVREGETAVTEP